jgi:hypothetical protein
LAKKEELIFAPHLSEPDRFIHLQTLHLRILCL